MIKRKILILAIFLTMQNIPLFGQVVDSIDSKDLINMSLEDLMNLKVSVSSVLGEQIFETPSSVSIIDRESIEKYNFHDLKEALSSIPGIEIYQTIIDRNVTTSRGVLQNFYANKILLLIDNIPTWQPIYGEGYIERISINDVERIEILKGPASVLYGSNAYTGVVNIILRKENKNSVRGYGRFGLRDITSAGFSANYKIDELQIFSSFNNESIEGDSYKIASAEGREFNGLNEYSYANTTEIKNFNLASSFKGHKIHLNWFHHAHSFRGAHPSYISGGNQIVANHGLLLNYNYRQNLFGNLFAVGHLTYDYFKRKFPLSIDRSNIVELSGDRIDGEYIFNYNSSELNLEFGVNGELRRSYGHETRNGITDELISSNLKNDDDIFEFSAFSRVKYDLSGVSFLVGGRYTNNENFGDNFSALFSSVYSISKRQSLKFMFGQSFRVPTMFELYFDHPTVVGNKELKPETSTSYEAAYLFGSSKFFIQILGFYALYDNLIQRVSVAPDKPNQYKNFSGFEGYGAEVELRYEDAKTINGFINYNYLAGDDKADENNYKFVPDHTISFGLNKNINGFYISLDGKLVSEVEGHLSSIETQLLLNVNFGFLHKINGYKMRHNLSVKNITDNKMYIPEYIRQTPNINQIATTDLGTSFIYSLFFELN